MWATSQKPRTEKETRRGFTIVELLVVIVVIGILAAIVIVAYNGVTQQARIASIKSDLDGAAKQLAIDQVTNSAYPSTLAAANNGAGLKASTGNTLAYLVNSASSPTAYCLSDTNPSGTYLVSTSVPSPTAAPSCTVTNMMTNPSFETDLTNWNYFSSAGTTIGVQTSGGAVTGSSFLRVTATSGTGGSGGAYTYNIFANADGKTYTASVYARATPAKYLSTCIEWHSNSATIGIACAATPTLVGSTWTRISTSGVAPVGTTQLVPTFYVTNGSVLSSGDVIDYDAAMATEGPALFSYEDGNAAGWSWTGTTNLSPSTGGGF